MKKLLALAALVFLLLGCTSVKEVEQPHMDWRQQIRWDTEIAAVDTMGRTVYVEEYINVTDNYANNEFFNRHLDSNKYTIVTVSVMHGR